MTHTARLGVVVLVVSIGGLASIASAAPDVLGGDISGSTRQTSTGGVAAYSFNITTCNVGTADLLSVTSNPNHPITVQNVFRLKNGRFEQIGMGWAFHHSCALQSAVCGVCSPACGSCCDEIGPGCSSPNTSGSLGLQSALGPRSLINPVTGSFPYPYTAPAVQNGLSRRVQVTEADLNPSTNPGAQYFVESLWIARDDAMAGSDGNNASYRRYLVSGVGPYALNHTGTTTRGLPAIFAWRDSDDQVRISQIDVPSDGRLYIASRATQVDCNTFRYEYSVYNLNSARAVQSISVPVVAPGAAVTMGFGDIEYHSGEPYSSTDWAAIPGTCDISWATQTFAENPNANAIRWGTMYNFSFESHFRPQDVDATLGLFTPGAPEFVTGSIVAPGADPVCDGDYSGDCDVGLGDVAFVIQEWNNPCGSPFGLSAISQIINNWASAKCP